MKKVYHISIPIVAIIGLLLLYQEYQSIGISVLLGMLLPAIFSYFNLLIIDFIMGKYGPQKVNGFNMVQFITKTIFIIGLSYIGIKTLNLEPILFITLLCSTWFLYHILEAFHTQRLFNDNIQSK